MEKRCVDVVVISDLHLGTYACKAKEVTAYLRSIKPQVLILNGDIIDVWQFNKHFFPSHHIAVIKEILDLMTGGTRVIYVTGNHDETLRRYTDVHLGLFQLVDKLVIEVDRKMTWIFHGDVFDNTTNGGAKFWARLGSNGYAMLIGFNKMINWFLRLAGKERISFSKSIMNRVNEAIVKIEKFETLVGELAIQKKYDFVICGHIHQPKKKIIQNNEGSVTYLNSGDWVEHLTSLEYFQNDWHLYTYDENHLRSADVGLPIRQEATVMTDEVAIYLHSLDA